MEQTDIPRCGVWRDDVGFGGTRSEKPKNLHAY